jgi:hypothetical protein
MAKLIGRLPLAWVSKTGMYVARGGPGDGGGGVLVHLLVVLIGVWLEGLGGWGRAGGENFGFEGWDGVVAD